MEEPIGKSQATTAWHRYGAPAGVIFLLIAIGAAPFQSSTPTHRGHNKKISANLPAGTSELLSWASMLENQVADLLQQRPDLNGPAESILELRIDLRLLARTVLHRAAELKGNDAEAAINFIRAAQLQNMCGYADGWAKHAPASLDADQLKALKAIHDLTFKPDDLTSPAKLDQTCSVVGVQMLLATQSAVPGNHMPAMRPMEAHAKPKNPPAITDAPPTIEALSAAVRALSVSVPLRRSLLSLADAAKTEADSNGPLATMLAATVDLARGLQSNTAVDPQTRARIEENLADGLALYTDPRTRSAGKTRIDSLNQYRQLLTRVGRLNLTVEQVKQFDPAFAWARENPRDGGKVLAAIEQYVKLSNAHTSAGVPDATLPSTMKKTHVDLEQQFANAKAQFVNDAESIGQGGIMSVGPAELGLSVDAMKQAQEACDLIVRVPADIKSLLVFRPRPHGGMEKQINMAVTKLSALQSPGGTDALNLIRNLDRLAQVTNDLADKSANDVPPNVSATYGGPAVAQFDARWRQDASALVNSLAANGILDDTEINLLFNAVKLRDALKNAVAVDAAMTKAADLQAWADWAVPQWELKGLLGSYQQAMIAAFNGFAKDNADPVNQFLAQHDKFRPMLSLIAEVAGYGSQLSTLPSGLVGEACKLATPMDHQPFETERVASYGLWLWSFDQQSGDSEGADDVLATLSLRLQREFGN